MCVHTVMMAHDNAYDTQEVSPVFTIDCPRHGATTLIWPSSIDGIRNTRRGIEVQYHCTCGHRGVYVTGRTHA